MGPMHRDKHNEEIESTMVHTPPISNAVLLNTVILEANLSPDFPILFTQFSFLPAYWSWISFTCN